MLEMYLAHKQNQLKQNNNINMHNLSQEDTTERTQTFTLLFSSDRYYNQKNSIFS